MDIMDIAIAKALSGEGGGSSLPAVTSDDNGDVLTVVNGAWDKAAPSGGGGNFVVTFTADEVTGNVSADKTFTEVKTAIQAGLTVVAEYPKTGAVFPLSSYALDGEDDYVGFAGVDRFFIDSGVVSGFMVAEFYINADNSVDANTGTTNWQEAQ